MLLLTLLVTVLSGGPRLSPPSAYVLPTRTVYAMGDSRTVDRADGQTPWPSAVNNVRALMVNVAVGGQTWTQCILQPPSFTARVVAQCGINDILQDGNGNTLFTTQRDWAEARAASGYITWWMSIPGCGGYVDCTAPRRTQRNNFNTAWASYCLTPLAGVRCVDIATALDDPAATDALLGTYSLDTLHYTTAGHAAIRDTLQLEASSFP